MSARRQRMKELIRARDRIDAQIVALGGIPRPAPLAPGTCRRCGERPATIHRICAGCHAAMLGGAA